MALVTPVGLQHRLKLTQARPSDIRRRVRHRIGDREAQGGFPVLFVLKMGRSGEPGRQRTALTSCAGAAEQAGPLAELHLDCLSIFI